MVRGAGQFDLAIPETWDMMLSAEASRGDASFSVLLLQIRRELFLPVRPIHTNMLFGHLTARDAPASGCRRMEEAVPAAVQGLYPCFAPCPSHPATV